MSSSHVSTPAVAKPVPDDMKLRGGQLLKFSETGFEVSTRSWFGKASSREVSWSSVSKIDVLTNCFSALVTVKLVDQEPVELHCGSFQVMSVAAALYNNCNRDPSADARSPRVPVRHETKEKLRAHKRVGLTQGGIVLKNRMDCCAWSAQFVPWNALVSAKLSASGKVVTAVVAMPVEGVEKDKKGSKVQAEETSNNDNNDTNKEIKEEGEVVGSGADEKKKEEKPCEGLQERSTVRSGSEVLKSVQIKGSADLSNLLFEELVRMAANGRQDNVIEDIKTKQSDVQLTEAGVFSLQSGSWGKGRAKEFLPWESISCLSWEPKGLFSNSMLTTVSLSDTTLTVPGATLADFTKFCETFQNAIDDDDVHDPKASSGNFRRKGLKLTEGGIQHIDRTGFTYCCGPEGQSHIFVPWSRVDALQVLPGRFFGMGARFNIITEGGQTVRLARGRCFKQPIWEAYEGVRSCKYGSEKPEVFATFDTAWSDKVKSEVNAQTLKVYCQGALHEYDLERVLDCKLEVQKSKQLLKVKVLVGICRHKELTICYRDAMGQHSDWLSAAELARLINDVAAKRRQELQERRAEAFNSSLTTSVSEPEAVTKEDKMEVPGPVAAAVDALKPQETSSKQLDVDIGAEDETEKKPKSPASDDTKEGSPRDSSRIASTVEPAEDDK